jgi:hypothetical protein
MTQGRANGTRRRINKRLTLLSALLFACASVPGEHAATPIDAENGPKEGDHTGAGLVITGEELTSLGSEHFGAVEITFQNKSSAWVQMRSVTLDFGDAVPKETLSVLGGRELEAWYRATVQRNMIRETNESTTLAALLVIGQTGSLLGAVADRPSIAVAGEAASGAALAGSAAQALSASVAEAEHAPVYPGTHVLSLPFSIPPGLFAKRWIALGSVGESTPCVHSFVLSYELEGGARERVLLHFRQPRVDSSEWQRQACANWPRGIQPATSRLVVSASAP